MNNRIDYIEDKIWIQKKIQLQEYFNKSLIPQLFQ